MEKIALIGDDVFIYWSPIIIALAAVAAIAFYIALYLHKDGNVTAMALSIAMSVCAGIPLARFLHWYHRTDTYESLQRAMTDYSGGGFALYGVFVACIAAACLLRLLRISRNLPRMLDCMAVSGGIGVCLGRLSCLFNSANRGILLPESVGFPFSSPILNAVSGAPENRLATFLIQSVVAGLIVLGLLIFMVSSRIRKKQIPDGDLFLIFMMVYGASQIICDSPRYDSLYLRSNGFVSIVQILGMVILVLPVIFFSVRTVMRTGFKEGYVAAWVGMLLMLGVTGVMEYAVQRRGYLAPIVYSVMAVCMILVLTLTLVIRHKGQKETG